MRPATPGTSGNVVAPRQGSGESSGKKPATSGISNSHARQAECFSRRCRGALLCFPSPGVRAASGRPSPPAMIRCTAPRCAARIAELYSRPDARFSKTWCPSSAHLSRSRASHSDNGRATTPASPKARNEIAGGKSRPAGTPPPVWCGYSSTLKGSNAGDGTPSGFKPVRLVPGVASAARTCPRLSYSSPSARPSIEPEQLPG